METFVCTKFVCGAHVGSKWAEKWVLYGIIQGFHSGPCQLSTWFSHLVLGGPHVGSICKILVPDLSSMWAVHGDNIG